jgi:quaternary ammonium compound-resistance protein SugE
VASWLNLRYDRILIELAGVFVMGWIYLVGAGLLEIGWPVGLKMAQDPATRWSGIAIAIVFMAASGWLLWLSQRTIPIGTAYAVWTGIGAAGTFLVGVMFYGDPATWARFLAVGLIIGGVVMLKLAH